MAWHHYTLVAIGLTASLCIQKGKSDGNSTGQTPAPEAVCQTPRCLSAANMMIQKMNLSANPCEDFNEFACGRFIEESEIPEEIGEVSTFYLLEDSNQATLNDIIVGEIQATDPQYLVNIKRFYNSCIDEETIEAVGLMPYLNEREFVDDWPTLNPSWSGVNFDLNEVISRYSKVFIDPFFRMFPEIGLPDSNKIDIYIISPLETSNSVQLNQLSTMYPELDIPGFARTLFGLVNITLTGDEKVFNAQSTYIGNISLVVQKFSNRTLQNLFGFKYAINRVGGLTRRMRQLRQEYLEMDYGATDETRQTFCWDSTMQSFMNGITRQFITRRFSERAKRFLAAMERMVGYSNARYAEAAVVEKYRHYIMKENDYYSNVVLVHKLKSLKFLATHSEPVHMRRWRLAAYEINANFDKFRNEIVFSAGYMQPPIYSETFQDYMNYGAIGAVIGKTITYGFADYGKEFDAIGRKRLWWTAEDNENFAKKTQCIIDQDSNTYVEELNMNLNGKRTLGESMGDRAGIKMAFRAYKNHVSKSGQQPRLPGLHLSQDQLFFLSFAQIHCAKYTHQRLIIIVKQHYLPRLPGKYRILGDLQNSEDFAKAYNCPEGSFMNPAHKCNVW